MAFKYLIDLVTAADLSGAIAAEKAVAKIGETASKSAAELDKLAEAGTQGGDSLVESLTDAGGKAGEGLLGKLGGKLEALGPAVLIPAAVGIGTAIGSTIGRAIEDIWTGDMSDKLDNLFAVTFSQKAQLAGEAFRQKLSGEMAQLNRELINDQKKFWEDYNNTAPENAGDWLKNIAEQADALKEKLQGLADIQTALMKLGKSQIEQDHLDEKQRIDMDPNMSSSQKIEANAANDAKKLQLEAEQRQAERLAKAKELGTGVTTKAAEVEALKKAEEEQKKRALVEQNAEANAQRTINQVKSGGGVLSPADELAIRNQTFAKASQESGLKVTPGQDEAGELKKTQTELQKAQAELAKLKSESAAKGKALAIDEVTDTESVRRTQQRTAKDTASKVETQRQAEWAAQEAEANKRAQAAADAITPSSVSDAGKALPQPGQEQTPPESAAGLRDQLSKAAQATGDSAQKMDLEALKNSLKDGTSAAELKEVAAMAERMATGNNEALRDIARAMRANITTQGSAIAALKAEMDSLRAAQLELQRQLQ